jgi:tetratricopeptide (TPR) repeat protein
MLAVFPEQTVATSYTSEGGTFEFSYLPEGDYQIIVEDSIHGIARQSVTITSHSINDIQIRLHGRAQSRATADSTVSLRELSLKSKARKAMQKGIDLLYKKLDYAGSLKQFEAVLQEDSRYYEAYAQMGVARMYLQDFAGAEAALRKAVEASEGTYAEAHFLLATLFSNTKRFLEAELFARQAVDLEPETWQGHFELGRAAFNLGRLDDAMEAATEAARLQPDAYVVYLLFADIHAAKNDLLGLKAALETYLRVAPKGALAEKVRKKRDDVRAELDELQNSPQPISSSGAGPDR